MLRKDLLIYKTRMLLDEFLTPMLGQVDKGFSGCRQVVSVDA